MLSRVIWANISRLVIDLYILGWGSIAIIALQNPEQMEFWKPIFYWRFLEYTSIIIYQRIFRAGFPQRVEAEPEQLRLRYRALLVDVVNISNLL